MNDNNLRLQLALCRGLLIVLGAVTLASCTGNRGPAASAAPAAAPFGLPAPKDIPRRPNYVDEKRSKAGTNYAAIASNPINLTLDNTELTFRPKAGDPPNITLDDSAAVLYSFPLLDYNAAATLSLSWTSPPPDPDELWVGVYNFASQRWEWQRGGVDLTLFAAQMPDYFDADQNVWVGLVLVGNDSAVLHGLQFGPELWRRSGVDTGVDDVDSGANTGVALNLAGLPAVAYHNASADSLMYASFDGANWTAVTADPGPGVGSYASLAFGPDAVPHIAYYDSSGKHPRHAWFDGNWHNENIEATGVKGYGTDIAIDSSGGLHVVYTDITNGQLVLASNSGLGWSHENAAPSPLNKDCSLVYDSSDHPHIAYNSVAGVDYAWNDGGGWQNENVVTAEAAVSSNSALDLDSLGNPQVVYFRYNDEYCGYSVRSAPNTWDETKILSPINSGAWSAMVLDSQDHPHICFYGDGLDYRYFDGTKWYSASIGGPGWLGLGISMAIGPEDRLNISYVKADSKDMLFVRSVP